MATDKNTEKEKLLLLAKYHIHKCKFSNIYIYIPPPGCYLCSLLDFLMLCCIIFTFDISLVNNNNNNNNKKVLGCYIYDPGPQNQS